MAKVITVDLPDQEQELLESYCTQTRRTQTDVIREFIRSLGDKIAL